METKNTIQKSLLLAILISVSLGLPGITFALGSGASADGGALDGGGGGGGATECGDGWDNDGNGLTDYGSDPGCSSYLDATEAGYTVPATQCTDGVDNDGNGLTDYPSDLGCTSAADTTESGYVVTQCNDNIDNDSNGLKDYPSDLGCTSAADTSESGYTPPQCGDTLDNDGDGRIDTADYGCTSSSDTTEAPNPQCSDSIDNDLNGLKDYPGDGGCSSVTDTTEAGYTPPPSPSAGIVVFDGDRNLMYPIARKDAYANGGIPLSDTSAVAHGYPTYPTTSASPTGQRFCYLVEPTGWPSSWSLGGYNSPSDNTMIAWNPSLSKWYRASANSFGNKRYNYMTCRTYSAPDVSLTASASGIPAASSITVTAGTPVTLTWNSQYGQIRKGTMTATNFSLTQFVAAYCETTSVLTCEPDYGGGTSDGTTVNLVQSDNSRNLAATSGSCWYETQQVCYPDQNVERPYGGSAVVTPTQTTTYTYKGTNANGSNTATAIVTVIPATAACADGLDNDGDGFVDMNDPGCSDPTDTDERTQCSDTLDNDSDGTIDLADPGCTDAADNDERYACADGVDNDGDGTVDLSDSGCSGTTDNNEGDGPSVSCSVSSQNVSLGGSATYTATPAYGASGPYTWTPNGGQTCTGGTGSTNDCTFSSAGSYQMSVSATGAGSPSGQCPVVTTGCSGGTPTITATPDRVKVTSPATNATVTWNAPSTCSCAVSGPGLASTTFSGTESVPITAQSVFTIDCLGTKATAIVNVQTSFDEF